MGRVSTVLGLCCARQRAKIKSTGAPRAKSLTKKWKEQTLTSALCKYLGTRGSRLERKKERESVPGISCTQRSTLSVWLTFPSRFSPASFACCKPIYPQGDYHVQRTDFLESLQASYSFSLHQDFLTDFVLAFFGHSQRASVSRQFCNSRNWCVFWLQATAAASRLWATFYLLYSLWFLLLLLSLLLLRLLLLVWTPFYLPFSLWFLSILLPLRLLLLSSSCRCFFVSVFLCTGCLLKWDARTIFQFFLGAVWDVFVIQLLVISSVWRCSQQVWYWNLEEKKGILGMRFTEPEYILIFIEYASSLFVFYFLYKLLHVQCAACMHDDACGCCRRILLWTILNFQLQFSLSVSLSLSLGILLVVGCAHGSPFW